MQGSGIEFPGTFAGKEIRRPYPGWILSGHQTVTGGRTDWIGGVAIRKSHARRSQTINVRSFVKAIGIIRPDIHVSEVIDKKNHHIRLFRKKAGSESEKESDEDTFIHRRLSLGKE
tara:strand:+ start:176 stop:523 length:348 start_codon:yes stop_codon:yes gene_type:complete